MPQFCFHVFNDIIARDEEGWELPNAASARQEAIEGTRDPLVRSQEQPSANR